MDIYLSFHPSMNNTEFYVQFEQPLAVTAVGEARMVTAGPGAIAELYRVDRVRNRHVRTSIGRYYLPVSLTIRPGE